METRTKPKDPNDPREYLPIPGEGRRILTLIAIVASIVGGCVSALSVDGTATVRAIPPIVLLIAGFAPLMFVAALLITGLGNGILNTVGIEEYWDRNVRGYRLACWLGCGPSGRPGEVLCRSVIAPGSVLKSDEVTAVTFVLPLGGWFRRTTVVMPKGQSSTPPLKRGQLRLHYEVLCLGPYPEVLPYGAIAGHPIQLRDRCGDRMTTNVTNALTIIERHGLEVLTHPESGLSNVTIGYQRTAEEMERERDHEQEAHRNARHMWTSALIAMEQTIIEIAKTSRFGGSIEALRIRLFLLEHFRDLVPTPDPKEPQRAKWIGWADEEIASARADLARRDRNKGRRPSAGAGT
ncbi:MAG: hypothetical protein Q7R80_05100 [bacterium]|nr:hypothetical protein [bacterium]